MVGKKINQGSGWCVKSLWNKLSMPAVFVQLFSAGVSLGGVMFILLTRASHPAFLIY